MLTPSQRLRTACFVYITGEGPRLILEGVWCIDQKAPTHPPSVRERDGERKERHFLVHTYSAGELVGRQVSGQADAGNKPANSGGVHKVTSEPTTPDSGAP